MNMNKFLNLSYGLLLYVVKIFLYIIYYRYVYI